MAISRMALVTALSGAAPGVADAQLDQLIGVVLAALLIGLVGIARLVAKLRK